MDGGQVASCPGGVLSEKLLLLLLECTFLWTIKIWWKKKEQYGILVSACNYESAYSLARTPKNSNISATKTPLLAVDEE